MELLIKLIKLLFSIVFLELILLFERKLDVNKLVDIVVIDRLRLQKFNPRNPVVSVVLVLASKFDISDTVLHRAFSDVAGDRDFEIEGVGLHECFEALEDIADHDDSKRNFVRLVLIRVVIPHQLFGS
jgi:hypothetical protein